MTFPQLLSVLADRFLRVRRLPGDRLECYGDGDLDDDLVLHLQEHRDEFLRLLPEPRARARDIHKLMVEALNEAMPSTWTGTPEQWAVLNEIDEDILLGLNSGDPDVTREDCERYEEHARSFFRMHRTSMTSSQQSTRGHCCSQASEPSSRCRAAADTSCADAS